MLSGLRKKSMRLPDAPGVYIMKNKSDEVIYIGKAKNLKNRVSTYFGSQKNHAEKVRQMVSQVFDFDYIITDSEFEALVLECNLIKQHTPKYNILLKDDKGYSYVRVSKESFPRISEVKKITDDGAQYIGPYMSSHDVKACVDEACKIFKLARCNKNFSKKEFKQRACLNYYINQCSAPCIGKIKKSEYQNQVLEAIDFLKKGSESTIEMLEKKMKSASEKLQFEQAAAIRDKIFAIRKMHQRQKVVNMNVKNQDIISLVNFSGKVCFDVFRVRNGNLCNKESFVFDEPANVQDSITEFIQQYYSNKKDIPPIVNVNAYPDETETIEQWLSKHSGKKVKVNVPKKGVQKKLLDMCTSNAEENLMRNLTEIAKGSVIDQLRKCLGLERAPSYIEAYDISNLAGTDNVAGMVVFADGTPLKSAYRRFKIKDVDGQDDYASMCEVISRRFTRYEKGSLGFDRLPDLILLDGGKGHVHVVKELLAKRGFGSIPVFGMVKDQSHKTRAITSETGQVEIRSNRKLFAFITKVQGEVHRFAISYHKTSRKKSTLNSELTRIKGIGKVKSQAFLKFFGNIDNMKCASIDELMMAPGMTKTIAHAVLEYFKE